MHRGSATVFVYGTLTQPECLVTIVGGVTDWHVTGRASVGGLLFDVGEYPALRLSRTRERVGGLLVEFTNGPEALALLDAYEDVPAGLYVRRRCRARLDDGGTRVPWVYLYNRSVTGHPRIWQRPDRW